MIRGLAPIVQLLKAADSLQAYRGTNKFANRLASTYTDPHMQEKTREYTE